MESAYVERIRYLVVITKEDETRSGKDESIIVGFDGRDLEAMTIGLVFPIWADTKIKLDGDGGFSVSNSNRNHHFKPISVQAMWSSLQTLHKASGCARANNFFEGGNTHRWMLYYVDRIESDRSCLNEWHAMDDLTSKRPISPSDDQNETKDLIRNKLKGIMTSVDLDEVTAKYVSFFFHFFSLFPSLFLSLVRSHTSWSLYQFRFEQGWKKSWT